MITVLFWWLSLSILGLGLVILGGLHVARAQAAFRAARERAAGGSRWLRPAKVGPAA